MVFRCISLWKSNNPNVMVEITRILQSPVLREDNWLWILCAQFDGIGEYFKGFFPLFKSLEESHELRQGDSPEFICSPFNQKEILKEFDLTLNSLYIRECFKNKIIKAKNQQ